jgi:hypothetical protein
VNAFAGCTALQKVIFPSTLKEVDFKKGPVKITPSSLSSEEFAQYLKQAMLWTFTIKENIATTIGIDFMMSFAI